MLPLARAQTLADRIVAELAPHCDRIQIAGSIRRQCPFVNDIDLVAVPKSLAELQARCRERATPVTEGKQNSIYRLSDGTQLDLFIAHDRERDMFDDIPSNWGSVLLCRTGSKEHNIKIAQVAQRLGLKWETMRGLVDDAGHIVAAETEQAILKTLNLDWIAPEKRER